jgi:hypothetical protein
MDRHCSSVHNGLRPRCPVCGKELYRKDKVPAHLRQEHPQLLEAPSAKPDPDQHFPAQRIPAPHFPAQHFLADPPLSLTTLLSITAELDELLPELFAEQHPTGDITAEFDELFPELFAEQHPAQDITAEVDELFPELFAEQHPAQDITAELDELFPELFTVALPPSLTYMCVEPGTFG